MGRRGHERCVPLTQDLVPGPQASWISIEKFALTFDAYAFLGFERCAALANKAVARFQEDGTLPQGLAQLRSCLFFEQRRFRHMDTIPTGSGLAYIHALLEAIRRQAEPSPFRSCDD